MRFLQLDDCPGAPDTGPGTRGEGSHTMGADSFVGGNGSPNASAVPARNDRPPSWADSQLAHLERQNRRLAFDIHDGVSQSLCAALLQVDSIESLAVTSEQRDAIAALRRLLDSALDDIHELVCELRPTAVDAEGLTAKLRSYIEESTVRTGLIVDLEVAGSEPDLSASAQIAVLRIVQESLNNVRKHARAPRASVSLRFDPTEVVCQITDRGDGFKPDSAGDGAREAGYGLAGMRERARFLDGTLDVHSAVGNGTTVTVRIPLWH